MKYYPVFMNIAGKACLVVGAGSVGLRKARTLARCGGRVTVVSRDIPVGADRPGLEAIIWEARDYRARDLDGVFLVFAATDNAGLNRQISRDAEQRNILCNIADAPDKSSFILPSVIEQGDLILAVSTSGASPALAKKIRKDLEQMFGCEYKKILKVMGSIRKKMLARGHDPGEHKRIFYSLIDQGLLELIKKADEPGVDRLLADLPGGGYRYRDLIS